MVKHTLRVGNTIEIGDIKIRLDHKSGQCVALVIDAPTDVKIKANGKDGYLDQVKAKSTKSNLCTSNNCRGSCYC